MIKGVEARSGIHLCYTISYSSFGTPYISTSWTPSSKPAEDSAMLDGGDELWVKATSLRRIGPTESTRLSLSWNDDLDQLVHILFTPPTNWNTLVILNILSWELEEFKPLSCVIWKDFYFTTLLTHGTINPLSFRQNLKIATENK